MVQIKKLFQRIIGSNLLDDMPVDAETARQPRSHGVWRFSLLFLVSVVICINLPVITRHYMVNHDSKQVLGIFDYVYSNYFFSGQLPQWMAYGLHGLDARAFYIAFLSAPSYLAIYAGKLLGMQDSLTLFSVTLFFEQLFYLLGMYLLSGWLFRERITRFCVCLTAVGTIVWETQLFFNLRIFCWLPLAFYLILRLRHSRKGHWGWLAGMVCILGPLGSTYTYLFWAFLLTTFSLVVFWGRFSALKSMFALSVSNLISALCFLVLTFFFLGTVWHSLGNFTFGSPGRDSSGNVDLHTFLTYGGNNLAGMISALVFPPQFMGNRGTHAGMADYVGLLGLFCMPIAVFRWRNYPLSFPFLITSIVVAALSLGGILSSAIYYFPGMHLFRHIGFLTGVMKMLVLILAGFGMDRLIFSIRNRVLIQSPNIGFLALACLALLFYVDLNIGGSAWASACEAIQSGAKNFSKVVDGRVIYTLGRALLVFIFIYSVWRLCRASKPSAVKKVNFALLLFVICVMGDCLFFQREIYFRWHWRENKFDFPVIKLSWPIGTCLDEVFNGKSASSKIPTDLPVIKSLSAIGRLGLVPAKTSVKYQTWTNGPGTEYQVSVSSILQWNPATNYFRADWIAKNVIEMQDVLRKTDQRDLAVISGYGGQKFRLLPVACAINVHSDRAALEILDSRKRWNRQVVVENPNSPINTNAALVPMCNSEIKLGDFSANQFDVSVSNGMSQVAWLIYADAYAPGWHATVNGKIVPVIKAYAAYKAVKVYPGISQVDFFYHDGIQSTCMSIFAILAGCGAAGGLGWLAWLIGKEIVAK